MADEIYVSLESNFRGADKELKSILNSRPLTRSSEDAADATAITPAHFLLQRPAVVVPIGEFNKDLVIGRRKWKQAQTTSGLDGYENT